MWVSFLGSDEKMSKMQAALFYSLPLYLLKESEVKDWVELIEVRVVWHLQDYIPSSTSLMWHELPYAPTPDDAFCNRIVYSSHVPTPIKGKSMR